MWKDTTSYSQGPRGEPTTWSIDRGGLRITVTSGHIHYRGTGAWVMHCQPWFDTRELKGATNAEQAQTMALRMVKEKIAVLQAAFQ